jgi:hypothetical protein
LYLCSQNDGDNLFPTQLKSINESSQSSVQNSNQQVVTVTTNPNPSFQIPPGAAEIPPVTNANRSSLTSRAKQPINYSAFRYRPKTLNTATSSSDKNLEQATKSTNVSSRKPTTSNKNEPVYATVGSVNSNQRLVKNLKSANV